MARNLSGLAAMLLAASTVSMAQTAAATQDPATEAAVALSKLREKPAEYVEGLAKYLRDFPDTDSAESAGYSFRTAMPKTPSPDVVRPLAHVLIEAVNTSPDRIRVRIYSDLSKVMLTHKLYPEALEMSTKGIALLDDKEYVEFERHRYERQIAAAKKRNPDYKPREFNAASYESRYPGFKAAYYATQARAYFELGKLHEAEVAFRASHDIAVSAESAWGLGDVLNRQGKSTDALKFYTEAMLTGKLKAADIKTYQQFFGKLNPGADVERYLDEEYRRTYHNPIPEPKEETAKSSGRAVLAEFVTGGGCVPCIPFDYSFERLLEAYPRTEFVLLVDHWHAPNIDPLGNHSVDSRIKLYSLNSAPNVFIDGKKFSTHDDNASESETRQVAPRVYEQLQNMIRPRISVKPGASLSARAIRNGDTVSVSANVKDAEDKTAKTTLQVVLVEKQVSYSGENGLRFQPMVVRNMAQPSKPGKYGFAISGGRMGGDYRFDLKRIMAENLKYYDEYPEERKAEITAEGRASILPLLEFNWREFKNVIDPRNLSVVVYLQNDETKEVLQSLYVPVDEGKGK